MIFRNLLKALYKLTAKKQEIISLAISENKSINKIMNKSQKFAAAYPESNVFENPSYASIYVRQGEGSYIDRVAVLPELPADHPVQQNMERWGFNLVARVYADQVASFVFKGFYNVKKQTEKAEGEEITPLGTYCSTVLGDRIENEDGEALFFNVFMFKGFTEGVKVDAKGAMVKDINGHAVLTKKGYIREVSFVPFDNKEQADRILAYKTASLPLAIKVKGIRKIDILASTKGRMFTVSGEYLKKMVLNTGELQKAQTPATITEKKPQLQETEAVSMGFANNSAADDLPF